MTKNAGPQINFLPEDYLERRLQRRTNVICLSLFGVVMVVLVATFLLKERRELAAATEREAVNRRIADVGKQLAQIQQMQGRKERMIHKADMTASLLERHRRSYVLAKVTNALPQNAGLLEIDLVCKPDKPKETVVKPAGVRASRAAATPSNRPGQKIDTTPRPPPPPLETVRITGLAPDDKVVSRFIAALGETPLFREAELVFSQEHAYNKETVRRFMVQLQLDPKIEVTPEMVNQQKLRPDAME